MRLSIFQRFLVVIGIPMIPLMVFTIIHYYEMIEDKMFHQHENNLILSRNIASKIDDIIQEAWSILKTLSVHPAIVFMNSKECDRIVRGLLQSYPQYLNIVGARMDGQNFCS